MGINSPPGIAITSLGTWVQQGLCVNGVNALCVEVWAGTGIASAVILLTTSGGAGWITISEWSGTINTVGTNWSSDAVGVASVTNGVSILSQGLTSFSLGLTDWSTMAGT